MQILLVNNLFQPEPNHLKGLNFARELRRRGHNVHVLTGFPNYPGGAVYPGYRIRWTMREEIDGVPVTRVAMYPSHDTSALRRVISYVSLGASQAVHAPFLSGTFDICYVYLGPLTLLWPAAILRGIHGCKIVADVQDIWPESVTDSGMLRSSFAERALDAWCRQAYGSVDRILVLSEGYRRALLARGIDADKVDVVHNWTDERLSPSRPAGAAARVDLREGAFNVVYAGNIGKLQGVDTILDAAKMVSSRRIEFTLIGDGVEASRIRRRIANEAIANVRMAGRMPHADANSALARADLLLIHVQATRLTEMGIPQKVQAYLAAGTPVLIAARGDAAEMIERSGGGMSCAPSDAAAMANAIEEFVARDAGSRKAMGLRGREFYRRELSFEKGMDRIEAILRDAAMKKEWA